MAGQERSHGRIQGRNTSHSVVRYEQQRKLYRLSCSMQQQRKEVARNIISDIDAEIHARKTHDKEARRLQVQDG